MEIYKIDFENMHSNDGAKKRMPLGYDFLVRVRIFRI